MSLLARNSLSSLVPAHPYLADPRFGNGVVSTPSDCLMIGVVEALVNTMEARDVILRGHSHRVAVIAGAIAEDLCLPLQRVDLIYIAARLHDIGKIGIRDAVLMKKTPLTATETAHLEEHVRIGVEILAPLGALDEALPFIEQHHERLDGLGYPNRLREHEISDGARIVAVADAFDTITAFRPNQALISSDDACLILRNLAGLAFDARVLDSLERVLEQRRRTCDGHISQLFRNNTNLIEEAIA